MATPAAVSDAEFSLTTEQRAKVLKQVEFYFSDSNLPRDAFMMEKVSSHPEGFVPLALLATFSRMSTVLKTSHHDATYVPAALVAAVAAVLEKSSTLALNEDRTAVKRVEELPAAEELVKQVDEQSIYASPFPFDTTLDELTEFFDKVGDLKCVRMRRHLASKDFRGSVFVEFGSPEEAERVVGQPLVFQGAPLGMEAKTAFMSRKEAERAARPAPAEPSEAPARPNATPSKRPRAEEGADEEAPAAGPAAAAPAPVEVGEYVSGCCVAFDFGPEPKFAEPPSFGLVKDTFGGKESGLKYADYVTGSSSGVARFGEPEQAQLVLEGLDSEGSMMVAGYRATVKVLQGDEERAYMERVAAARAETKRDGAGDTVTQLQSELNLVTSLLYNFIGTTQRDAVPATIKGEGLINPANPASIPIDLMSEQLTGALSALASVIDALPKDIPSEEEQIAAILKLQEENVNVSEQLAAALREAQQSLSRTQMLHAALADAVLMQD